MPPRPPPLPRALLARLGLAPMGAADPQPQEIEVFHINPYHLGPYPVNMNTGDAMGDLVFDMKFPIMFPLSCQEPDSTFFWRDCKNKEVSSPDLVVSRLRLQVSGEWSPYAMCNIGLPDGTTAFGDACPAGTYCCVCDDFSTGTLTPKPCHAAVGRQSLQEALWGYPFPSVCNETAPDWMCWQAKLPDKVGTAEGYWYSSLDYGYCPSHRGAGDANCTWQVAGVDKIVNRTCQSESFFRSVEAYNKTCFDGCGATRNTTSPCWVRCFYAAVLGPDAGRPGGAVAGMPLDELRRAWMAPFETDDPARGGCPGLPLPLEGGRGAPDGGGGAAAARSPPPAPPLAAVAV